MAYFSNSSEGSVLDEQCLECFMDIEEPCPIAYVQMNWNYKQIGNDMAREILNELVEDGSGDCRMKQAMDAQLNPGRIERIMREREGQRPLF